MRRCPACGVYKYLAKNTPKDTLHKEWHKLVYAIDGANHDVARSSIHQYIKNEYMYEGKGLSYLKAMINSANATYRLKIESEKKKFGSNPPEIKL